MTRVRSRIAASTVFLALAGAVLLGACSDSSPSADREAQIVAAAVRALVPPSDDETTVTRDVFVGGDEDTRASLTVQADVLKELDEFESIRFVDDRSEAISDTPPHAVHSDGVYLEVGPVPKTGSRITVPALRYIDRDDQDRLRLRLARSGATWTVTAIESV
jgi:hypothetical protein